MVRLEPVVMDSAEVWDHDCEDEYLWWPRVLWIDPGDITGVSCVWFDPAALFAGLKTPRCILAWSSRQISGAEDLQIDQIMKIVAELGGPTGLAVGCESFVMQQFNMSDSFLAPVRLRAKLEFGLHRGTKDETDGVVRRRKVATQSASDAKNTITDQRLKIMQMYTPGPDHIRDATRHCLLWLRRLRSDGRGPVFFRSWHGWEEDWFEREEAA